MYCDILHYFSLVADITGFCIGFACFKIFNIFYLYSSVAANLMYSSCFNQTYIACSNYFIFHIRYNSRWLLLINYDGINEDFFYKCMLENYSLVLTIF